MASGLPNNSDISDSVRKLAISRRDGVKNQGGRLPPLNMKDFAQITGSKKTIAPKIPQRRVKKEKPDVVEKVPLIKTEFRPDSQNVRDERRNRRSKVILQTEGTLLAQGPAPRIKREPADYESISIPRRSTRTAANIKPEADSVKMWNSYNSDEDDEDDFDPVLPLCLPRLQNAFPKIKEEPLDNEEAKKIKEEPLDNEEAKKIKEEPLDNEEVKTEIKSEPENKWNSLEGKFFSKIKTEVTAEARNAAEEFQKMSDEGALLLLQIPSILPFKNSPEECAKNEGKEKTDSKPTPFSIQDLPEGYVGKLQILKSGKKRLLIGSIAFELIDGTVSETLKEVASVQLLEEGGDMVILGKIDKKMILRPMIELLEENYVDHDAEASVKLV